MITAMAASSLPSLEESSLWLPPERPPLRLESPSLDLEEVVAVLMVEEAIDLCIINGLELVD